MTAKGARQPILGRFERFAIRIPFHPCWEWAGSRSSDGYGGMKIEGRTKFAHRLSYELHVGPIPDGLFVCHACDNPGCVRPDHLFAATHMENVRDRDRKGRQNHVTGERHGCAKLTRKKVRAIRRRRASGERYSDLAREFGISPSSVRNAAIGKAWR